MATEWCVHVVCACADGRYMVDREREGLMMWWMNHASVVLQYKRGLLTEKRNKHKTEDDPTPEQLHLEKRAFYRMKVAQDNVLREAWQEKQIGGELRINKKMFHRLDDKLNSISKRLDNKLVGGGSGGGQGSSVSGGEGEGGGGHEEGDFVRREALMPSTGDSHPECKRWGHALKHFGIKEESPRLPTSAYKFSEAPSTISLTGNRNGLATHPDDRNFDNTVQLIAATLTFFVRPAEISFPGVPDSSPTLGVTPSPAQSSQTQSSPARTSRLPGLKRLPLLST